MVRAFNYLDYRDFLRDAAAHLKSINSRFRYGDLAREMGVQAPYLSRVFRGEAHLSSDQLHQACEQLELTEDERQYLFNLLEYQKSGLSKRKNFLKKQLDTAQAKFQDTKNHLSARVIGPNADQTFQEYYLNPLVPLIHSFMQIPSYQSKPEQVSKALGVSSKKVKSVFEKLEKLGLLRYEASQKRWLASEPLMHLDKASTLNQAYQTLFRNISSEHLQRQDPEQRHQYAVTITTDESTYKAIFDAFNQFIKKVESLVNSSQSEGVYQLNFDWFRWDVNSALIQNDATLFRPGLPVPQIQAKHKERSSP